MLRKKKEIARQVMVELEDLLGFEILESTMNQWQLKYQNTQQIKGQKRCDEGKTNCDVVCPQSILSTINCLS